MCCLGITSLIFVSTAIVFWSNDYCRNVLFAKQGEILSVFIIVCLSGPILGILSGGAAIDKFAGGYEGKHSLTFGLVFVCLAMACGLPVRAADTLYTFALILWGILFFGGASIPSIQGVMISSLKPDLRASGYSISNIFLNGLGFLPAPFIYGFIYELTKKNDQKLAMMITLYSSILGVIFIAFALMYRLKHWDELSKPIKPEEENEELIKNPNNSTTTNNNNDESNLKID